jgi:hypothetical protein
MIAGQDRIVGAIFSFPRQIICWNVRYLWHLFTYLNSLNWMVSSRQYIISVSERFSLKFVIYGYAVFYLRRRVLFCLWWNENVELKNKSLSTQPL